MSISTRARFSMTALLALPALLVSMPARAVPPSFVTFESGPVRPVAISGNRLYVCNTPDGVLEIFDINSTTGRLSHFASVPVGVEPVAVAVRPSTTEPEVWVVNHVSDSVSVIKGSTSPRVARTILVGDEPNDVVFAANGRAFITTAHRGEQRVDPSLNALAGLGEDLVSGRPDGDPQLTTPGIGRADVWVFDPSAADTSLGGVPLKVITLFGDSPRALAVDGNTVYAAIFKSGNQTATVSNEIVCDGFQNAASCAGDGPTSPNGLAGGFLPGGNPGPDRNVQNIQAPETGLIVKFSNTTGTWQDELGRNWSNGVRFSLPDQDVFSIDASTLGVLGSRSNVGTVLFNMAIHPVSHKLYVSNVDSQNLKRFEGHGT
ncbi:MAG TPA: hypothetical protein VK524_19445, partial [Polyangiaceae bacterium]|nr:hypothetical protein [Polyangiaceae bacterium]